MSTTMTQGLANPNVKDINLAVTSSKILSRYVKEKHSPLLQIFDEGRLKEKIEVPASALRLFADILTQMAEGHLVGIVPLQVELSTQQAAEALNVSRPFLVQLLESGDIPFRKVGTKRRVLAKDITDYKKKIDDKRLKALKKLSSQAQKLDMGY